MGWTCWWIDALRYVHKDTVMAIRTARVIVAEMGVDMSRFPTAHHLASWAGLCPGNHESAAKRRSGKARKGDAALRAALIESAWAAARTRDTYLAAQFHRFCRRFGKKGEAKAAMADAGLAVHEEQVIDRLLDDLAHTGRLRTRAGA